VAVELVSPVQGVVVEVGTRSLVLESMKMEFVVEVPSGCELSDVRVAVGQAVDAGQVLAVVEPTDGAVTSSLPPESTDPSTERTDLAAVQSRQAGLLDPARPAAVARRRERGRRTARENVEALLDPGSFSEIGGLAIAAQRRRRDMDDLVTATPADGMVAGTGRIYGVPVAVVAYDPTVLAGTQGMVNHLKLDRICVLARRQSLPVVIFAEGGGGRPGDVDAPGVSGLDVPGFHLFASLADVVPLIGIAAGFCFAGNAALLASCHVVIATEDSFIGMGGPAMIEGGGLGVVAATDIGPSAVQTANGTIDVLVPGESAAARLARTVLGILTGVEKSWAAADQTPLRDVVPERRRGAFDPRQVIDRVADVGSVIELKPSAGGGMITSLGRLEGLSVGFLANDPTHLGGAIDARGCERAADFLELCDRFEIPVVSLVDTPGFMVGPEAEAAGTVRRAGRLFRVGAGLEVPLCMVVLRKAYGLGAQAMGGGSLKAPDRCVSWPTGEFGGMGLEGAVRLGFRRELDAIADPVERAAAESDMVRLATQRGGALNIASHFEIDDVIDPADTREVILATFAGWRG